MMGVLVRFPAGVLNFLYDKECSKYYAVIVIKLLNILYIDEVKVRFSICELFKVVASFEYWKLSVA